MSAPAALLSQGVDAWFLAGGGGIGALTREHDWTTSPLGPPAGWPPPLRTLIGVLFGSAQPMFIAWGPARAMLYNEGYATLLGARHPGALGRQFFDVWPEIVDSVGPIMDRAYAGEPTHMDDIALVIERNGPPEEAHFAFSYTPVRGEGGQVEGMFCACSEITQQVFADRRRAFLLDLEGRLRDLAEPRDVMAAAAEALGRQLGASGVGYAEADAAGELVTVQGDWRAAGFPSVRGTHRWDRYGPALAQALRAGRTAAVDDTAAHPFTRGAAPAAAWASLRTRAFLDVPLVKQGRLASVLFVVNEHPRTWPPAHIVLVEDVAERTWAAVQRARAEASLRASEARHRQVVESAQDYAIVMLDAAGCVTAWSRGAERMTGYAETEALGQNLGFFYTDEDVAAGVPAAEIARARAEGRAVHERWHLRRDRSRFWGSGLLMPLADLGDGGSVKIFRDMTASREAAAEREELLAALGAERARLRAVFEAVPIGLVVAEAPSGRIVECNAQVEAIVRHPIERTRELPDYGEWVAFHADGRPVLGHEYPLARALRGEAERPELVTLYRRGDGTHAWLRLVAAPVRDAAGTIRGGVVATVDIDAEKRAIDALEAARDRQRLLIGELNHRVKNTLATVQSLAQQTLRSAETPTAFAAAFGSRLMALAGAHDLLTREAWEGVTLGDVAEAALAPWLAEGRVRLDGPPVRLAPKQALALSMALGELATNAVKHGALSVPAGRVALAWRREPDAAAMRATVAIDWVEAEGPPVRPPARRGLGSRLLGRPLAAELGGSLELRFDPAGVRCAILFPAEDFAASAP